MSTASRYQHQTPSLRPKERYSGDIAYAETAFVYRIIRKRGELGGQIEAYATKPTAIRCSVQSHIVITAATDSLPTNPATPPERKFILTTRYKDHVAWHDKILVRNIEMLVIRVEDRFELRGGAYLHTEIETIAVDEPTILVKSQN